MTVRDRLAQILFGDDPPPPETLLLDRLAWCVSRMIREARRYDALSVQKLRDHAQQEIDDDSAEPGDRLKAIIRARALDQVLHLFGDDPLYPQESEE